jgi:hypothetical protein
MSQRDEKGRFIAGNIYTKNIKRDDKGRFIKSSRKDNDNSLPEQPKSYDLSHIEKAFYAGANASRFYSIVKQWEIYREKNYEE